MSSSASLFTATYEKSSRSSGFARLAPNFFEAQILYFEDLEIMELNQLTIHELQEKIKNGDVSATQITESVFSRIDAVEERVHSYIRLMKEEALLPPQKLMKI